MTLREIASRARRDRRPLIVLIAASGLAVGVASAGHAAGVEAETRATLVAEIADVRESIAGRIEVGHAVVDTHFTASVCMADVSSRLGPVTASGLRFTATVHGRATAVVQRAAEAAPVPAYDPAAPLPIRVDAGVDELESALVAARDALTATDAEIAGLASGARAVEQACESARAAEAALIREITRRSEELVAGNPKAAAETLAALSAARDAAVAFESGAVERWIAAAGALEASHAAAVAAEQAAEADRQAAAIENPTSSWGLTFDGTPAPGTVGPVELTDEQFCQLVPSMCIDGRRKTVDDLPLDDLPD